MACHRAAAHLCILVRLCVSRDFTCGSAQGAGEGPPVPPFF